ncbi:hypothetical protein NQZ68_034292 [Dissostichus eleginoides]|nr:hypothetical protein NQZ68_034292 [Dissostichus eleginoides]
MEERCAHTRFAHSAASPISTSSKPPSYILSFMLLQAYIKVVGYLDGAFQIRLDKKETQEETLNATAERSRLKLNPLQRLLVMVPCLTAFTQTQKCSCWVGHLVVHKLRCGALPPPPPDAHPDGPPPAAESLTPLSAH